MTYLFECVYCGEPVPDGCPHPNVFSCCGEVGHVVESEAILPSGNRRRRKPNDQR
jgi:hypothetical protein